MDANGTRFHAVLGEDDWTSWLETTPSDGLVFDAGTRSLSLAPVIERFRTTAAVTSLDPSDRRGADCDAFGTWYWIDRDRRRIWMRPCTANGPQLYWSIDQLTPRPCHPVTEAEAVFQPAVSEPSRWPDLELCGLAVTERNYLVAGTKSPAGLLLFDLHAGGPPSFEPWPAALDFEPFDVATAHGGGVWILDIGAARGARYWRLDSWLRPVPIAGTLTIRPAVEDQFGPIGSQPRASAETVAIPGTPLDGSPAFVEAARAIVGLPDDSILLLDAPAGLPSRIVRVRNGAPAGVVTLDELILDHALEAPARITAHDIAFVPGASERSGHVEGVLYVVGVDGNQAFAFDLVADDDGLALTFRAEQLLLRQFGGMAIECCGGRAWYDLGDRFLPIVPHPRRRFVENATAANLIFDSRVPDCHWRRVMLDACIPAGTSIDVASRAANEVFELSQNPWRDEPGVYLRAEGSELPFHQPFCADEPDAAGLGVWETAFQAARGRFIELRLTLRGGGRLTPRLRALRAYSPAFSYVDRYLPSVYREDPVSSDFLDRYLANVEGLFTALEGRIGAAQGLFDPRITPEGYLEWLAGWMGAMLDPDWDSGRRRLFLRFAELLFRWRGTPGGLVAMIRLAIEECPDDEIFADLEAGSPPGIDRFAARSVRLVETFQTRGVSRVSLGDPTSPEQPGTAAPDRWTPAQGSGVLHQRYAAFLAAKYAPGRPAAEALPLISAAWNVTPPLSSLSEIQFSPVGPAHSVRLADWRDFISRGLGFAYSEITQADLTFYRQSLLRRWGTIGALNAAWRAAPPYGSFEDIALPAEDRFPATGAALRDWISFTSLAIPIRDAAHHFTVLCPISPSDSVEARTRRLALVRSVVDRERPSHTACDIKPFWALFQVGSARLGLDTAIGEGARFTGIELGLTALGDGFLQFGHPWNVADRSVLGAGTTSEIAL